jgi:hypothetical protein
MIDVWILEPFLSFSSLVSDRILANFINVKSALFIQKNSENSSVRRKNSEPHHWVFSKYLHHMRIIVMEDPYHSFTLISLMSCICFLLILTPAYGDTQADNDGSSNITFKLTDLGPYTINSVNLMKVGPNLKDGHVPEQMTFVFSRDTNEIIWTPCNGNSCSFYSYQTSGGKTGPAKLNLDIELTDPEVDVSSCHYDYTCERLLGGTKDINGFLLGTFRTGHTYNVSLSSLIATYNPVFDVKEVS